MVPDCFRNVLIVCCFNLRTQGQRKPSTLGHREDIDGPGPIGVPIGLHDGKLHLAVHAQPNVAGGAEVDGSIHPHGLIPDEAPKRVCDTFLGVTVQPGFDHRKQHRNPALCIWGRQTEQLCPGLS
eukprot:3022663-Heterocapsa_arctica.AAC.1